MAPNTLPPDTASLAQSLAETASGPGGDPLAQRQSAVSWLRAASLLAGDAELTGSEHAALLRLRGALRDLRAARANKQEDPEAAVRLSQELTYGRLVVTVTPAGTARLASSARAPYSCVVAAIAIAIAQAGA